MNYQYFSGHISKTVWHMPDYMTLLIAKSYESQGVAQRSTVLLCLIFNKCNDKVSRCLSSEICFQYMALSTKSKHINKFPTTFENH